MYILHIYFISFKEKATCASNCYSETQQTLNLRSKLFNDGMFIDFMRLLGSLR